MERDHGGGFLGCGELIAQLAFLRHQFLGAPIEACGVTDPLNQPIGDPVGFLLDRREAAFEVRALRDRVSGESAALVVIFPRIGRQQRRVAHFGAQAIDHRCLNRVEIQGRRGGTVGAFGMAGADQARAAGLIATLGRHAGAAGAASQETGQHPLRLSRGPRFVAPALCDPCPDLRDQVGRDDRKIGDVDQRMRGRLVRP